MIAWKFFLHFYLAVQLICTASPEATAKQKVAPSSWCSDKCPQFNLTMIVRIKDEVQNILEFIQHHYEEGVEHFFIYDDYSADGTTKALHDCIPRSLYTLFTEKDIHFTGIFSSNTHNNSRQLETYARLYVDKGIRDRSKWVMLLDADEFMTSRSHPDLTVKDLLLYSDLSSCDIVSVPWLLFSWGIHEHVPANKARETLFDRWSYDDRYAIPEKIIGKSKKFHNINEYIENKVIVRTERVRRLAYVHEADFFDPDTNTTGVGIVCIPHEMAHLKCVHPVSDHVNKSSIANPVHKEGSHGYYRKFPHLPENCPPRNNLSATMSAFRTKMHEEDVEKMKLIIFHYRVRSLNDFNRLSDPHRHSGRYYAQFRSELRRVNRMDVTDDFMISIRAPARANLSLTKISAEFISKCPGKYFQ